MTSNRHELNPAELVDFRWPAWTESRWVDGHRYISDFRGDPYPETDARVLVGRAGPWYYPLRSEPLLYRRFATLADTEDAFARFADAYGDLGTAGPWEPSQDVAESDHATYDPEFEHTLAAWSEQRELMARAVRIWDALTHDAEASLLDRDIRLLRDDNHLLLPGYSAVQVLYPEGLWLSLAHIPAKSSARKIAQAALASLVSDESQARIVLAETQTRGGGAGLRLTYSVDSLREAMWLQLALAVDGNRRYETCPVCGDQWDATDARSDRETCSDRCRKRRNREAKQS